MELPIPDTLKILALRRDDACSCGTTLPAGTRAAWFAATRTVQCLPCSEAPSTPALDVGIAGGSAQAEFDRRHAAHEQRVCTARPRLGGLLLALSDDPQSTRAWEAGAIGEQRLAAELATLGDAIIALLDRRVPGSRANIDHIVVRASGVFVIDAKCYKNAEVSIRTSGGFFSDVKRQLLVSGRDKTPLAAAVHRQVGIVRQALAGTQFLHVPIAGALCFIDAEFTRFGKPLVIDDVHVRGVGGITKLVARNGNLEPRVRSDLATTLSQALPAK